MTTIPVSLTVPTFTNQTYDMGTGVGTTSYAAPAFTTAGAAEAISYTSTSSPSTPQIVFTPSSMTTTWGSLTTVGTYVVTIEGTTSPSNVKAKGSFTITVSNSCSGATITTSG